jgi:hypothetical protein
MKALMLIAFAVGSIYAQSNDMDGRLEGVSPTVVVRDTSFSVPTERVGKITPPPEKENQFILEGFDYHSEEVKPWDILMEGNVDFRVDGL